MGVDLFIRLSRIFYASQVVWKRMQTSSVGSTEWDRLRKKHKTLRQRYIVAREMASHRIIN